MSLITVSWPESEGELSAIVAMLEAQQIPCFFHRGSTGSRLSGMQVLAPKPRTIMVPADRANTALKLIRDFLRPGGANPVTDWSLRSTRLRARIERVLFGEFPPRVSSDGPYRDPHEKHS